LGLIEKLKELHREKVIKQARKEANSLLGNKVGTIYGTCEVIDIVKDIEDGKEYVKFKEKSGEEFFIDLASWDDIWLT
jgi:hypothetical protein